MSDEEAREWLVGFLAVKMKKSPEEVRRWKMKDAMLIYNTMGLLAEMEQRQIEKAKRDAEIKARRR